MAAAPLDPGPPGSLPIFCSSLAFKSTSCSTTHMYANGMAPLYTSIVLPSTALLPSTGTFGTVPEDVFDRTFDCAD